MERRGCRRWLICVGGFFVFFLQYGMIKSLGLLINDITADLQISRAFIGFCIGLVSGVSLCLSVVTIPLSHRYPARPLIMLGGAVSGLAVILASVCPNGSLFGFMLFLAGTGNGLYSPLLMVLPKSYFPHRFGLVLSIMLLGCSAGIMILPVITQWFVAIYNWRWALAILGALNLNTMVVGAMIQNCPQKIQGKVGGSSEYDPLITRQRQDNMYESSPSMSEELVLEELHVNQDIRTDHSDKRNSCFSKKCESFHGYLAKTFDTKVFTMDTRFIAIFISQFFCAISYCCWIVFLIPNAESKGLDAGRAAMMALFNGGSNAFGRIGAGLVSWRCSPNYFVFFSFLSLMTAAASLSNAFAFTFWQLSIAAALAGFSGGFKIVISNFLCKEATTDDLYSSGLSWTLFIFGLGEPLGEVIMGALYDQTSSYAPGFIFVCAADFLSAIAIVLPIIIKASKRRVSFQLHSLLRNR